jgi:hypothetical protein
MLSKDHRVHGFGETNPTYVLINNIEKNGDLWRSSRLIEWLGFKPLRKLSRVCLVGTEEKSGFQAFNKKKLADRYKQLQVFVQRELLGKTPTEDRNFYFN